MALYELLHVDFQHCDQRGSLVQLVHDGFRQVNILESKCGCVRGGHYHKVSCEAFFVIKGCVEVTLKALGKREVVSFREGDFFLIRPYITHSMFFPEDCLLAVLYDVPVEQGDGMKDIYVEETQNEGDQKRAESSCQIDHRK